MRHPSTVLKTAVWRGLSAGYTAFSAPRRLRDGLMPPTTRQEFAAAIPREGAVLEIGPFDVPQMTGANVRYFDVLDQEGLRRRAEQEGRNAAGCPVMDYVSPTGDLSIINETFDTVFSSHVIEHQYRLVQHFIDVGRVLKPGGAYFMMVPDKRYCFDHFMDETKLSDVMDAEVNGPQRQVERAIHDVHSRLAHNDSVMHWTGRHGKRLSDPSWSTEIADEVIGRTRAGEYRDVHVSHFTPGGFRRIVRSLHAEGRIPLRLARVHDTRFGQLEFFATLVKDA